MATIVSPLADIAKELKQDDIISELQALYRNQASTKDIFGNVVTSQRGNQIEVPLNDPNWEDFVSVDKFQGTAVLGDGQVTFSSGTHQNGRYGALSLDQVRYRAHNEIGWGWTALFPVAGVASSYQRIGATEGLTWQDGVWVGYENDVFGLTYSNNGDALFIPQASWDDPCLGAADSNYTTNGVPVVMNPAYPQIYRVLAGLFGHAGWILQVYCPDGHWETVHSFTTVNTPVSLPLFKDFDLRIAAEVKKTGADASNLRISSSCWAGWTGLALMRMADTITDRTLAQPTVSVIQGRSTKGGGTYYPAKVTPSGALLTVPDVVPLLKKTAIASASGDNVIYTPTAGTAIRLYFFGYSASASVTGVTVGLTLEGYNGGLMFDQQYLSADGQPYARNIKAGAAYIEGAVDGRLIVNLSAAQAVIVNLELEEV